MVLDKLKQWNEGYSMEVFAEDFKDVYGAIHTTYKEAFTFEEGSTLGQSDLVKIYAKLKVLSKSKRQVKISDIGMDYTNKEVISLVKRLALVVPIQYPHLKNKDIVYCDLWRE